MTTTTPKIYSFAEFEGVADAVAKLIIDAQDQALSNSYESSIRKHSTNHSISGSSSTAKSSKSSSKSTKTSKTKLEKRFKIAISGGSLIGVLSNGLLKRDDVKWEKWDVYFADERLVPFNSPDSNYGSAKREVFDKLKEMGKPLPKVYHIDEKLINDPQEVADEYEKILIKGFASKDSVRLPLFDLFLLGCAPDGHIASIFPQDHDVLREKLAWVVPVEKAPSGPPNRITLTIPVICHSHRVSFVVEGAVKASIVKVILERPEKGLPASVVNELAAGRVSWFVDKAALTETYL